MSASIRRVAWLFALLSLSSESAFAQQNPGNGNNNNNNVGGIRIDAKGIVQAAIQNDHTVKLDQRRKAALIKQALPGEISQSSDERLVSLVQLEARVAELLERNEPIPLEIQCLAGLTRLDRIYLDIDHQDMLIAGPAEAFVQSEAGRWVGLESGRPVLLLDDLLVALRSVTPQAVVGVSIDPVPARLVELQKFVKANSTAADPALIEQRFRRMREILGNHAVRLTGVPDDSQFARGLLEADYRMKLLALGLEQPGVKGFKSHLSMAGKANTIQRWWFVPFYDEITKSSDGLAYEFSGQRAQLLGEDELANAAGERFQAATKKISTQAFSRQFTEKFPQLAAQMPVFSKLQQLIDWTVLAALIQQERLVEQAGWRMTVFLDAETLPHEVCPVPRETECVINTKQTSSGLIVGQLSGGVTIQPRDVLQQVTAKQNDQLSDRRKRAASRTSSSEGRFWWD